jgi:hypothetical protein
VCTLVTAPEISGVDDADLGSLEFWGQPAQERDRYFAMLRREAPISRHEPPEDILGLGDQGRLHYWAIVRAMDAPRHTKLRSGSSPRLAPAGDGDFVQLIAKRLPLETISDMLGVPEADRERVMEAADTLIGASDPDVFGDRSPLEVLGTALWTLTELRAHPQP